MHAHRIEIFNRADDDAVVVAVAHHLHLELFPAENRFLDQNFAGHKNIELNCKDIRSLKKEARFDYIVSTLPFNSFSKSFVVEIMDLYFDRMKEDGVLSFFEYMYLPTLRGLFISEGRKEKLSQLRQYIESVIEEKSFDKEKIYANIPPAVVYYLKKNPVN